MNDQTGLQKRLEVRYDTPTGEVRLNPNIVKRYLVHGRAELITETEIIMFMQLCRYQKMNPYLREAYLIKFSEKEPASIVVGKYTFTKRASEMPVCQGYNAGIIVKSRDGKIERRIGANLLDQEELIGGWAKVFRKGWIEPLETEVSLKEYMRFSRTGEPTRSWATMKCTMIRKCALVAGIREALPGPFANQYTPEEMPFDDSDLPTAPVQITAEEEKELDKIAGEGFEAAATTVAVAHAVEVPRPAEQAQQQPLQAAEEPAQPRPGNSQQKVDRNPFTERHAKAKEAEDKAERSRPRSFSERMGEGSETPEDPQEAQPEIW